MSKHDGIIFVLKKVLEQAVTTQDLAKTIRFINDYIENLE